MYVVEFNSKYQTYVDLNIKLRNVFELLGIWYRIALFSIIILQLNSSDSFDCTNLLQFKYDESVYL